MPNLAIVFYGHARSFRHTFENFKKNVLEVNLHKNFSSIDIFIHTWNILEHAEPRSHYQKDSYFVGKRLDETDCEFINMNYKPSILQINEPVSIASFDNNPIYNPVYYHSNVNFSVSYLLEQAAKAITRSSKTYDRIILTRLDINFLKPLNLKDFVSNSHILPQFRFSHRELTTTVFYPYVQDCKNLIRSPYNQVTAIDLLSIFPSKCFLQAFGNCHQNLFNLPSMGGIEDMITTILYRDNITILPMYYEKPTCFTILRTNQLDKG